MSQQIDYIAKLNIPVNSAVSTGTYCSDVLKEWSADEYKQHIVALIGKEAPEFKTRKQYHILFAYICQNMVKQYLQLGAVIVDACVTKSIEGVNKMLREHPYFFYDDSCADTNVSVGKSTEKKESVKMIINGVARPKGWKAEQALKIMQDNKTITREVFIDRCIKDLGMSPAGALTYFYNSYKAVHGVNPPSARKGKSSSTTG